jgi:DNA polymerase sigma
MVIHFLQQIDPPILPCLHEYVFGIDHVPLTLNENQYSEFFRISTEYSREWKSNNSTNLEILFLQLLSYYIQTFNTKQFVVSIQTRMPVVKIDKNWHSRKLLVEGMMTTIRLIALCYEEKN